MCWVSFCGMLSGRCTYRNFAMVLMVNSWCSLLCLHCISFVLLAFSCYLTAKPSDRKFNPKRKVCCGDEITIENVCSLRFVGGKLNVCYNAVDRHVESGRGDQAAVIYDSAVTTTKRVITFREMQDEVCFGCLKARPYLSSLLKDLTNN